MASPRPASHCKPPPGRWARARLARGRQEAGAKRWGRAASARAFLPCPGRPRGSPSHWWHPHPGRTRLILPQGGGICVDYTSLVTGVWLPVRTWRRNQSRALLGEAAPSFPVPTPPERLHPRPRAGEWPTAARAQPALLSLSPAASCHIQGRPETPLLQVPCLSPRTKGRGGASAKITLEEPTLHCAEHVYFINRFYTQYLIPFLPVRWGSQSSRNHLVHAAGS